MKKKILSLVLVVAMLASMLVFAPTSGAVEAKVNVWTTDAVGSVGQTVSVDIMMTTAEEVTVYGYQLGYAYDSTKLKLENVTYPIDDEVGAGTGSHTNKNGEVFGGVCEMGPFDVIGRTYATGFTAADTVIATLHFTALVAGTVEVGMVPMTVENGLVLSNGAPANCVMLDSGSTVYYEGSEIACDGSTVSVLPANYIVPNAGHPSDFTASVTGKITAYNGASTGTVVIPKQGKRSPGALKDLKAIAEGALYGTPFTTLIIPAHITSLEEGAIYDPAVEALKVIVLGEATAFAKAAVLLDESDCVVTICGYAGSTAEAYAESEGYDFEALDLCSLAVGDASYLVPANTEIAAPGVMTMGDDTVIGWKKGDVTYAAGAAMTLTEDTELTAVTIDAIKMNTGIQFQMGESIKDCKMRYTTDMKIADYNTLASLGTVTLGTIITPAKYVSLAGGLTKEALTQLAIDNVDKIGALKDGKTGAGLTYIDVPATAANPFGKTADTYTFAGSLAGFKNENVNTKNVVYAAAFYATVELADGSSFTIYSNFDLGANRSVGDAITAMTGAGVEGQLTKTEADKLRDLIAKN